MYKFTKNGKDELEIQTSWVSDPTDTEGAPFKVIVDGFEVVDMKVRPAKVEIWLNWNDMEAIIKGFKKAMADAVSEHEDYLAIKAEEQAKEDAYWSRVDDEYDNIMDMALRIKELSEDIKG